MKLIHRLVSLAAAVTATAIVLSCSTNAIAPDPSVPQLLAPVEGAVLDNGCVPGNDSLVWDFDWSDVPGATGYELFVQHQGSAFAEIDDSLITQSSFHYSLVASYTSDLTAWRWWVRAKVNGADHGWGGPVDFSVEAVNTDCP
jgi:hypothetical protein